MLGSAVVLAISVSTAACDTLGALFGADVVWDRLGVLGSVGGNVVCTDAGEVEGLGVAVVLNGVRGVGGSLETDQRAGILLVGAPDISCGLRDSSNTFQKYFYLFFQAEIQQDAWCRSSPPARGCQVGFRPNSVQHQRYCYP